MVKHLINGTASQEYFMKFVFWGITSMIGFLVVTGGTLLITGISDHYSYKYHCDQNARIDSIQNIRIEALTNTVISVRNEVKQFIDKKTYEDTFMKRDVSDLKRDVDILKAKTRGNGETSEFKIDRSGKFQPLGM